MNRREYIYSIIGTGGLGVLGLSKYSVKSAEAKVTNFTISNINDNNIVYLYYVTEEYTYQNVSII
jgi:hypothetical protein